MYGNSNNEQKKTLDTWRLNFEKKPQYAANKATTIFEIRQKENVDYLTALMLKGQEYKKKKNEKK